MCGRYLLTTPQAELDSLFGSPNALKAGAEQEKLEQIKGPRFNIPPSTHILAIATGPQGEGPSWAVFQWGLVPSWRENFRTGKPMINARFETAAEKPSFRSAFKKRRCLIPANGFYEWKKAGAEKIPHLIRMKSQTAFAFAGLWETWNKRNEIRNTCAILTTSPNQLLAPIHHRMPVIVPKNRYQLWLGMDALQDRPEDWAMPYPEEEMEAFAVSNVVNRIRNNSPACLQPRPTQNSLF